MSSPGWAHSDDIKPELNPARNPAFERQPKSVSGSDRGNRRLRKSKGTACEMARYKWLDKAAEANPALLEAVAEHHEAARILVNHPHLAALAEADPNLCRYLTQYKDVARMLADNPDAERVIALDPEGIYRAIKKDKEVAKLLARNPRFNRMISQNPVLGRVIATYM